MSERQSLMIVVASTRPGRVGLPIAEWVAELSNERPRVARSLPVPSNSDLLRLHRGLKVVLGAWDDVALTNWRPC